MSRLPSEDMFEGSRMSFGEHLEELRGALLRSLFFLGLGVVVGLLISTRVTSWIQSPLQRALDKFYVNETETRLKHQYANVESSFTDWLKSERMTFEDVYFEKAELQRLFAIAQGADEASIKPGYPDKTMVRTRLWQSVHGRIVAANAQGPFMAWIKVGVLTGLTLAAPCIFWQIWMFVAEGLYPHEKKYVYLYLPFSLMLFALGACIAFFFAFEPVLEFLFRFNAMMNIDPLPRIDDWLGFVLLLPLGFGIGFQLPLVMLFLYRIHLFSIETYLSQWRTAVLIIFGLAMILTPGSDPTSMLLLAIPLTLLYFVGIALCKYLPANQSPFGEGYDPT